MLTGIHMTIFRDKSFHEIETSSPHDRCQQRTARSNIGYIRVICKLYLSRHRGQLIAITNLIFRIPSRSGEG